MSPLTTSPCEHPFKGGAHPRPAFAGLSTNPQPHYICPGCAAMHVCIQYMGASRASVHPSCRTCQHLLLHCQPIVCMPAHVGLHGTVKPDPAGAVRTEAAGLDGASGRGWAHWGGEEKGMTRVGCEVCKRCRAKSEQTKRGGRAAGRRGWGRTTVTRARTQVGRRARA